MKKISPRECDSLYNRMVGLANETEIQINNCKCKALLDKGSMISTISEFMVKQLKPVPDIRSLDDFMLSVRVAISWVY